MVYRHWNSTASTALLITKCSVRLWSIWWLSRGWTQTMPSSKCDPLQPLSGHLRLTCLIFSLFFCWLHFCMLKINLLKFEVHMAIFETVTASVQQLKQIITPRRQAVLDSRKPRFAFGQFEHNKSVRFQSCLENIFRTTVRY